MSEIIEIHLQLINFFKLRTLKYLEKIKVLRKKIEKGFKKKNKCLKICSWLAS
jgi:hypothetical protein